MADRDLDERVRARLRALRTERGLTLADVAESAVMDVSTLSRLESGKRRLAVDHLPGLARALGVTVDELLGPSVRPDPRVRRPAIHRDGLTLWPLSHDGPVGGLQAFRCRIDAARDTPPDPLPTHPGRDWIYVLDGRLRLCLSDHDHVIHPGEAVEFSTLRPHWFGAVDGPVDLIAILGPHGSQVHWADGSDDDPA